MDVESTLLAKALSTGELEELATREIEPHHFADDEIAEVYEYSLDFLARHQQPPSMAVVKQEFPGFKPKLSKDPLGYHIDRFEHQLRERKAIELVRGYHDMLEDPEAIKEIEVHALDMATELVEVLPQPRVTRLSDGLKRKEEYYRRKKAGILHGIQLGIPTYDEITLGLQPHELLIWGGPPGGGKTTGMQYNGFSAYMQYKTVLFISLEVEAEQILRKFDTMLSKIRYRALKALELDVGEEEKWTKILERAEKEKMERDIIVRDDIKNCTVSKVALEQLRYKPDIVIVDYLEEMRGHKGLSDWQSVQENGRGLKQNARITKVPCVTGTQLNREGETSYQSAQKIADMLIVLRPDEEDEAKSEMKLEMRKYRDGPSRTQVTMRWHLETMDIHEKGQSDRFPERHNLSLTRKDRKREQRLDIATVVGDRPNPWTQKRGANGHKKTTKKTKKDIQGGLIKAKQRSKAAA